MNKDEAKELYQGKYFYEIVRSSVSSQLVLVGPIDTIRYISKEAPGYKDFRFAQVINGNIVAVFKENEILVTDKVL